MSSISSLVLALLVLSPWQTNTMKYFILSQLLTRAKKSTKSSKLKNYTYNILDFYYKFIVTDQIIVLIRKAIPGTCPLYCHCCKSTNTSCSLIAPGSSQHAQTIVVAVVVVGALVTNAHTGCALPSVKEGGWDKSSQSGLQWELNFHSHAFFNRAPGCGSICRVKWPLCRVNTWAAVSSLERKQCCAVKKENKHCKTFRTKLFSQR